MQLLSKATTAPSPEVCAGKLLDALPGVMGFVRRQMRSRRASGLSVPQFRTLVHLSRCDSATLSAVSEHLGCSMPTASRLVGGLVGQGLVQRRNCRQDRRQVSLQLTSRGAATLEDAWTGTRQAVEERLGGLRAGDRTALARAMEVLEETFRCNSPTGQPCKADEA